MNIGTSIALSNSTLTGLLIVSIPSMARNIELSEDLLLGLGLSTIDAHAHSSFPGPSRMYLALGNESSSESCSWLPLPLLVVIAAQGTKPFYSGLLKILSHASAFPLQCL